MLRSHFLDYKQIEEACLCIVHTREREKNCLRENKRENNYRWVGWLGDYNYNGKSVLDEGVCWLGADTISTHDPMLICL